MSKRSVEFAAKRQGSWRLAGLLAGAGLLLAMAAPARAGIAYDFEQLSGGTPTGVIVGHLELPSLAGTSALPLDFSYSIAGFPFGFSDVVGASWNIDFATGAILNLALQAQDQNAFPGSSLLVFATLSLGPNNAINTFSDSALVQIFNVDNQTHRIRLVDDGGLLDPPLPGGGATDVPEPASLALLGMCLAGLAAGRRARGG